MNNLRLESILNDNSFDQYYVEYNNYVFNHLSQGIVALQRLGADEAYIKDFIAWYTERLEEKEGPTHLSQKLAEEEPILTLRGRRKDYYRIVFHYETLLADHHGSLKDIIRSELPKLILGMAGPAIHGLIHLGYGVVASNSRMVCESLAFLHHSYLPLITSDPVPDIKAFGRGKHDILEVLKNIKQDDKLRSFMLSESQSDWVKRLTMGVFGRCILPLVMKRGDDLLKYVHDIKLPDTLDLISESVGQMRGLLQWLLDTSIVLYHVAEKRNDFYLLHGVTSCWALQQTLLLVDDFSVSVMAVRVQLALLLTVYLSQGASTLRTGFLSDPDVSGLSWDDIRARILGMKIGTDEHIYKLVQVCYDTSKNNTDTDMADVYKRACLTAMEHEPF